MVEKRRKLLKWTDTPIFTQIFGLSMHFLPSLRNRLALHTKIKVRKVRALKYLSLESNDKL